jgi:L-fucose dehydrogenase
MDLKLAGKVVVISGGAKGIGEAISLGCAAESAIPVMLDRDGAALSAIEQKLSAADHPYGAFQCELTDPVQCERAIQSAVQNFGKIDALVNNAGVNDRVGLESGSPKHYVESLERNLFHYYNLAHFALPALKASSGSIVNVASKTAVTGQGGTSGYASAKGAALALTREWAVELLAYQIRVNAVVPAEVMTPLYQQWLGTFPDPQKKLDSIVSRIPLGSRMTRAEEIASAVLFLLSEQAGHITGQHLYVDGGYVHLDRALN